MWVTRPGERTAGGATAFEKTWSWACLREGNLMTIKGHEKDIIHMRFTHGKEALHPNRNGNHFTCIPITPFRRLGPSLASLHTVLVMLIFLHRPKGTLRPSENVFCRLQLVLQSRPRAWPTNVARQAPRTLWVLKLTAKPDRVSKVGSELLRPFSTTYHHPWLTPALPSRAQQATGGAGSFYPAAEAIG